MSTRIGAAGIEMEGLAEDGGRRGRQGDERARDQGAEGVKDDVL